MMTIDLPAEGKRPRLFYIFDGDDYDFYVESGLCSERLFVERALTLGAEKTAIIFPIARLNTARWLESLPLAKIHLGPTDFCLLLFDRTHSGPPELRWLDRDDPR